MRFFPKSRVVPSYHGCVLCFSENPKYCTKTCEYCLLMFFNFPINDLEVWEINFEEIFIPFSFCNCSHQSANQFSLKVSVGSQWLELLSHQISRISYLVNTALWQFWYKTYIYTKLSDQSSFLKNEQGRDFYGENRVYSHRASSDVSTSFFSVKSFKLIFYWKIFGSFSLFSKISVVQNSSPYFLHEISLMNM